MPIGRHGNRTGTLWLVLLCTCSAYAGESNVRFENLTVADGLSQSSVYAITQDKTGFMWFGTLMGLNRFDGYHFKVYTHDPKNPNSLSHDFVRVVATDQQGRLWAGTMGGGLNRYDPANDHFYHFRTGNEDLADDRIEALESGHFGFLWVGTSGGLQRLDPHTGTFTAIPLPVPTPRVTAILPLKSGRLWVGTDGQGAFQIDENGKTVQHLNRGNQDLSDNHIHCLFLDDRNLLWIGTENGLNAYDPTSQRTQTYQNEPTDKTSLSNNIVRTIHQDRGRALWIATDKGLNRWQPQQRSFLQLLKNDSPNSLMGDNVHRIYEDRSGLIWVGGHGGLSKWNPSANIFKHYQEEPGGLSASSVTAFAQDPKSVWIGTYGGGLNRMDLITGAFRYYRREDGPGSISDNRVGSLHLDPSGTLWVGTFGAGLNRMLPEQDRFESFRHDPENPQSLSSNAVTSIGDGPNGDLYITAYRGGLNRFDPQRGVFTRYQHDPKKPDSLVTDRVTNQAAAKDGGLWLGTVGGGLVHFDPVREQFTTYQQDDSPDSLGANNVFCVYEDRAGNLWVGTQGSGLNRWEAANRKAGQAIFSKYTRRDGLPDNLVYGILPGKPGTLWLSTGQGISRLDVAGGTFKNFHKIHGLQADEFNSGAYLRRPDGQLFFGGVNGFNAFYPNQVREDPVPAQPALLDFLLYNEPVKPDPNDDESPLQRTINHQNELVLNYRQDVFALEFTGLHFVDPSKNRFAYKLEGLNDEWVYTSPEKRFASYTTLKAGNYLFRLKAGNHDGVWSEDEATLKIHVEPPPWQSRWAYLLYALFLCSAIVSYMFYQRKRLAAKQHIIEQLTQVDRLKDDFLANTSHELRTPLGGIIGLAESLVDGVAGPLNTKQRAQLEMLVGSGRRLSVLVDDILDFSKLRNAGVDLTLRAVDLYTLVDVVLTLSRPLIGGKDLALENQVDPTLPPVHADENRLAQILHNLVGNAVKFSEKGQVIVGARRLESGIQFWVKDTGIGIAPEHQDRIFQSFQQLESAEARTQGGTGLGLAITKHLIELHGGSIALKSALGKGTTFTVNLPESREAVAGGANPPTLSSHRIHVGDTPDQPVEEELVDGARFTILVVDDEPVNRQVLKNHLSLAKYRILEASGGKEALERVADSEIDLVLLDVMMPRMSGYEVCRRLRRDHHMHVLPIIFLTARTQLRDLTTGLNAGANDYLTKPIAKRELLCRVRTHLALLDITRTLEQRVAQRTQELKEKNDELKTLDRIVKTINRELTLQRVLQVLLEQGMALFEQAEKAGFILLDHVSDTYEVKASVGHDVGLLMESNLSRETVVERYTQHAEQMERGVYLIRTVEPLPDLNLPTPKCLLTMAVTLEGRLEGFLVLCNFQDKHAFDQSDVRRMARFREHAISAVAKARFLEELQEKNEEIMRTQNQLIMREKMVSLGTLTAGIAHEIKNPLNFINNFGALNAELVKEGLEHLNAPLEQNREALQEILNGLGENGRLIDKHGQKANHIVQSMMMLSREGVGQRETYDLNSLVEEYANLVFSGLQAHREDNRITFDRDYDPAIPPLNLVVQSMGRVILSLVTNAVESLQEKQEQNPDFAPKLWLSTAKKGREVVITVKDNGMGFDDHIANRIFTPFFTTKDHENNIGLGLFISYDIVVQEHHGSLSLESEPDHGCSALITLPLQ